MIFPSNRVRTLVATNPVDFRNRSRGPASDCQNLRYREEYPRRIPRPASRGPQARSGLLVAALGEWLQTQRTRVSVKSRLGEKLAYIADHWVGLQTFLNEGHVEIDSNQVENLIHPIALNRKNALFAGHDEGGKAWGRIASLIETAKIDSIEPCAYLKATLEAIAAGHPKSQIDDLLPWNFKPSS